MAKQKLSLNELTNEELRDKLKEDGAQYTKMKFNHAVSPVENPMRIRQMRRDIARMKTEISKRNSTKQT
ncbi:MAG: 50S ribosomal protein L29 [Chitinophagales bacterium]|nr:50S ribosomal protein L29 [Chitinophagales bacterium]